MKRLIKKGIEKLPLVYQLADVVEIEKAKGTVVKTELRPNRFMKLKKYNSEISEVYSPIKPVSKII